MQRCYNPVDKDYHLYGQRGVVVCEKWQTFAGFLLDVVNLPGYTGEALLSGGMVLDKDIRSSGAILYSDETCCFVSKETSNKLKPNQMKAFVGTSASGEVQEGYNQSEFSAAHGLRQSSISDCLTGRLKTHKGWTFKYKD